MAQVGARLGASFLLADERKLNLNPLLSFVTPDSATAGNGRPTPVSQHWTWPRTALADGGPCSLVTEQRAGRGVALGRQLDREVDAAGASEAIVRLATRLYLVVWCGWTAA